ncbi:MAG: hypothetical protein NTW33_02210 [Methanoregula sp.]|nr:hypothetical protein [Methanoregula sp.]
MKGCPLLFILAGFLLFAAVGIGSPATALDDVNSLMQKGISCYYAGDNVCGDVSFASAYQLAPDNSQIFFTQALILSQVKNYPQALEKIDTALVLNPGNARMWYEKGKILDRMGRFMESGSCYDRAVELNPSFNVPVTDRFPLNVLIKNSMIIVMAGGFILLGIYIYFRERRR